MPNQNPNGRNISGTSDEQQRPSWRTQDQMRDDRDDERSMSERDRGRRDPQDEGYRMSERYGQGQSGYSAGRYNEDRSFGFENRNPGYGGRYEDRQQSGMGMEDRFSSRGGWQGREGYGREGYGREGYGREGYGREGYGREGYGRSEEGLGQRGYGGGDRGFGGAENRGYSSGYTLGGQGGFGSSGFNQQTSFNPTTEGREGYGMPGMGRTGGYGRSQSFSSMGGSYGGYGQNVGGGGMQGGYGQQGSTQSGFGQEMRGMFRGKGPQGWQRSDERIREMICEMLTDDDNIDASNIEVKVTNADVVLLGTVPDRMMKRMAEDIVERMSGVKDVTNQIKVGKDQDRSNPSMSRGVGQRESEPSGSKHRA